MAFKLRSGNGTTFKNMGTSPFKDMKTGSYKQSFESPAKQRRGTEGQDQDKIFNDKGEHVGNYVNDKKVMFTQDAIEDAAGVTTNIKMPKVMKDGPKNRVHVKDPKTGKTVEIKDWQPK